MFLSYSPQAARASERDPSNLKREVASKLLSKVQRCTVRRAGYDEYQGTINTPITFESCTGFVNENLNSIRIAQALAYSSTLISILSAVYEFFAKRELRKQARERAENGDDAQITLDIEAAPAQIALLQLEVGSQKKNIDVLHRTVDVVKKAADASKQAFQKQVDEIKQLLLSRRPAPPTLPV
ncbi:uncharacterized protein MICPUCDRAFT_54918 [Micromonas pusilla CCMP1545]|uniref:Predicted protein n=1 Tax=Micromonas pusilla (strain CCMP1545) TaxID=564608 RepID=C1NAI1_MICPC|nr:uncharacterized protein MICPUCDRAFT_54918 [Micromonas pusilla CCMP1545]EEH50944.1 predicted protein [Micromonas pusilla CCMP1545]|eukprot:XP_003064964.1 predicted protein [Micromonas pusilla CCMP1545]